MKKFLLIIISAFVIGQSGAQSISVILEYKAIPDSFYLSMVTTFDKPVFNLGPSQITLVFSNNYDITATPSLTIATTSANTATWTAQDFALEALAPNKKYVGFQTTGANIGSTTMNVPKLLFRFRLTGVGGNCIGSAGFMRNYINGFDLTDPTSSAGGDFSAVINEGGLTDYFTTNANTTMQTCSQLVLPVNLLEFNARRENKNAVINWSVTGEEINAKYYELERSIDGVSFKSIAHIDCRRLSGIQNYEYVDLNIVNSNAKTVYYRLRQYDFDARFILSGIRNVRLGISDRGVQVFPNPATEGFYVSVPFVNPDNRPVKLNLIASNGQIVAVKQITAAMASNYYFDIKTKALAAGSYNLQIIAEDKIIETKRLNINQ